MFKRGFWTPRMHVPRWPTSPDGWAQLEAAFHVRVRAAVLEVAEEIGAHELADEVRAISPEVFPAAEYLRALNQRASGAGNRAFRLAQSRRPRR